MRNIQNLDPATITELPRLPDTHGATWDNAADRLLAAGWRKLDPRADVTPPDGMQIGEWTYEQDPERAEYALEAPVFVAIPVPDPVPAPVPTRFDVGIDAPLLVLDAPDDERGIGYVAADDGTLLPLLYAHASPYDMEAVRAKAAAAREARAVAVAELKQARTKARASAAAAQNVPQVREALADLDARLTRLEALLGVTE
jgi:hypothetical protein